MPRWVVPALALAMAGAMWLLAGLTGGGQAPPRLHQVPNFSLTDSSGATFGRGDMAGSPWVVNLFFTSCPDVCPGHMALLKRFQGLGTGARVMSISVDPETDTPVRLAAYAERLDASPVRWVFLTGRPDILREVLEEGFLSAMGERSQAPAHECHEGQPVLSISHSTRFLVIDREGWIRGLVSPDGEDPVGDLAALVATL